MYSPAIVYLDQTYLGRMCGEYRELGERVLDMTARGVIVCPTSIVHLMETCKAPPQIRGPLFALMEKAGNGHFLRNELSIVRNEFYALSHHLKVVDYVRSRLLTTSLLDAAVPSAAFRWKALVSFVRAADRFLFSRGYKLSVLEILNRSTDSRRINDEVNQIFSRAAANLNQRRDLPPPDVRSLARFLEVAPDKLSVDEHGSPIGFPSIAVRRAIQTSIRTSKKRGFEANDIPDVGFLSSTLPYFDLVTVDRKMGARVREAHHTASYRASVVSDINELAPALTSIELQSQAASMVTNCAG